MELITLEHLPQVLQEYGEAVREAYRKNLIASKHPTTENQLASTIEVHVDVNGSVYSVSLSLQEYWAYVERGTRPHWPPREAILKWITIKPVIPRPDKNGKIPSEESLAFLIGRKIAQSGTMGTHDLDDAIEQVNELYKDKLIYALREDCQNYIQKLLYNIQGSL